MMATQKEYTVRWPEGGDKILVVSVGAGIAAATQKKRPKTLLPLNDFPTVFMNGASIGQNYLCRAFGRTAYGLPIDREIKTVPHGRGRFRYDRYNAALGQLVALAETLKSHDLPAADLKPLAVIQKIPKRKPLKLDVVGLVDDLYALGGLGRLVDVKTHFAGFTP